MMKFLHICIYIGILFYLVDLNLAKKKNDENTIVDEKIEENELKYLFRAKSRKHLTKNDDDEDGSEKDDVDDDISGNNDINIDNEKLIYVCGTKDSESICTCKNETLDCHKQLINGNPLKQTYVKIRRRGFIVKTADFNNNGITILKKGYLMPDHTENLKCLMLWSNSISSIENNVFDAFNELETLELHHNLLIDIDDHVLTQKLGKTLKVLQLGQNKFKRFSPRTFIHLHNLKELYINKNPIMKFSKEIFPKSLANLKYLHIASCNIKTFDDDVFENLKSLHDLILVDNPLTSVPKALNGIPHLFSLDLSATHIERLSTNAFDEDSSLNDIWFMGMPNLTAIDDCAFCGLSNLTKLGFWQCKKLFYIHENAFGALTNKKVPQIDSLFFSETNITVLPEKLLNWEAVKEISVWRDNPFTCNCSMAWLINDFSQYKMFSNTVPKCANPPELANLSFTTVSGTICLDNDMLNSDIIFWPIALFAAFVICIIVGFLYYTRRVRKTVARPDLSQMTYRNLSAQQQHEDDEELRAYF